MAYPISDVTRRVVYSGSAGVGPYSFSFEILTEGDIGVYKNTTLLTLTTDYTVTINADGTGSITLVSAATSADTVAIFGSKGIQRSTDFVTGGDLFANSLNDELDAQTIFAQQNSEAILRSLRAPVTDPTTIDMTLPSKADRADTVLTFDTNGNPQATPSADFVSGISGSVLGANYVTNNATGDGSTVNFTLSTAPGAKGNLQIYIDGVYQNKASFSLSGTTVTFTEAPPLNASIEFIIGYSIGSTSGDATGIDFTQSGTGAVTRTVASKLQDVVSVKDFGAVGDGVTDDTAAIQSAIDANKANRIYFPAGVYKTSDELLIPFNSGNSTHLFGANRNAAKIYLKGVSNKAVIRLSADSCTISDLGIAGESGYTGNSGIRIAPEDETQTTTRVNQSYNIVRDCDFSGTLAYGITIKCGPDVGGPDSGAYHNLIHKCRFGGTTNVGVHLADSTNAGGSPANRNWINKCYFTEAMNVGVWNEAAATTYISENSFEGVDYGTSPMSTPTAVVVPNAAPVSGKSNDDVALFNNRYEGNSRDIFCDNNSLQIIGDNATRSKCYFAAEGGADPLVFIGGQRFSQSTQKLPGYKFQTNSQEAGIPNSSPVFDNGIFLQSTSSRLTEYEEGTFVPYITDATGSASEGQTYSKQVGQYTRIGNRCFFDLRIRVSSLGTLTTTETAQIHGLPFTALNLADYQASFAVGNAQLMSLGGSYGVTANIGQNQNFITPRTFDTTSGTSNMPLSEFSTGDIAISGSFEIES